MSSSGQLSPRLFGSSCCDPTSPKADAVLLLGGRYGGSSESYSCDLTFGDIAGDARGMEAAVLNNEVYVCGGKYPGQGIIPDCYKNKGGLIWEKVADMNKARTRFSMNLVGNQILAAGGNLGPVGFFGWTDSMEVFDGTSWTLLPTTLFFNRSSHCAVTISDTEVVFLGGYRSRLNPTANVHKFDLSTQRFQRLPNIPTTRSEHACAFLNGDIYVAGGVEDRSRNTTDRVDILNVKTKLWRTGPPLINKRFDHSMEVLNGEIMVFGGNGAWREFDISVEENTVEILRNGVWVQEFLQYAHSSHTSVTLPCA